MGAQQVNLQPKSKPEPSVVPGLVRNKPAKPGTPKPGTDVLGDAGAAKRAQEDFIAAGLTPGAAAGDFPDLGSLFSDNDAALPTAPAPVIDQVAASEPMATPPEPTPPPAPAALVNQAIAAAANKAKPPSSRRQYQQEQRAGEDIYANIEDIFSGAAGIVPETGFEDPRHYAQPVQNVAPAPAPQETVYQLPDRADGYEIMSDDLVYVDGQGMQLSKGQVIYDPYQIEQLIAIGYTDMVPVNVAENFAVCPRCQHKFPPSI